MLQIEWKSSHYHSDGRRRSRPKASTVHGWLVKWRATFSGNERLRKEGIREMREAKALREQKRQKQAARRVKAGTSKSFRLWPICLRKKKKRQSQAPKKSPHSSSRRPSRGSTRRLTAANLPPKPVPANKRRPSQKRKVADDHKPSLSARKPSYNSRGETARLAEKKQRSIAPT